MANTFSAYTVYNYDASGGHGMAGRIADTGSVVATLPDMTQSIAKNINGDPKVEGVAQSASNLDIVVTDYVNGGNRPVYVYNAVTGSLDTTVSGGWSNVDNLYTLVQLGSYLYAIDYDNARVVEIDPSTYAQTGISYTLAGSYVPSGYAARGQALIVIGSTLYGLFTFVDSGWSSWAPSLLVRFSITGGSSIGIASAADDTNANLAPNAFAMDVSGSDLYVAAIGGAQGSSGTPNAASRLQSIPYGATTLGTATVTDVMKPSNAGGTYPYEFRDISFNGGTAYVLMGTYNASWNLAGMLVSTTDFVNFTVIDDFSSGASGYFWMAQYTADNDRLWYAKGNRIVLYDASSTGTPVATMSFTASAPYNLVASGQAFDNLNDFAYVGPFSLTARTMRGYRSPLQASRTPRAARGRALAKGRPELLPEEFKQLDAEFA